MLNSFIIIGGERVMIPVHAIRDNKYYFSNLEDNSNQLTRYLYSICGMLAENKLKPIVIYPQNIYRILISGRR